jgi:hypothetical protein
MHPETPVRYRVLLFTGGSVVIPAGWQRIKSDDETRIVVRAPDDQTQVTVSPMYFEPFPDKMLSRERFNRLLALRLDGERKFGGDQVTVRDPVLRDLHDGTMTAPFEGSEGSSRRFAARLAMKGGVLLTVYIEAIGGGQQSMSGIAAMVFDSISLRNE